VSKAVHKNDINVVNRWSDKERKKEKRQVMLKCSITTWTQPKPYLRFFDTRMQCSA